MSLDGWSEFQNHLNKEELAPLYLLYGDETFLVGEATDRLKQSALSDGGAADFNFDSYVAGDVEVSHLRDAVETLPMMAARRVIVLRDAHKLKESEWETLHPLLENPVDSSVFILTAEKLDKRKKHSKTLLKQAQSFEFKPLYEKQVMPWVSLLAKRCGLQVTPKAANLLVSLVGNSLGDLDSEIRKLSLYKQEGDKVSEKDVAQVVSRLREESVFDFTRAIAEGDRAQALFQLVQLLDQGQNEIAIVYLVARHFRILVSIQEGIKAGLKGPKLAAKVGVPGFFLTQYIDQAKRWSSYQLKQALVALEDTDKALKSSPLSSHIWLENFILRVCGSRRDNLSAM